MFRRGGPGASAVSTAAPQELRLRVRPQLLGRIVSHALRGVPAAGP
ncbi:hypothetical protein SCATT_24320 [Streptantibioticus cattleyicolor NRRL 8057 = DSM 46488]|uniref:Uncharacterized protein n=1 Tax=Streptantibioticus cattleyicolor (strain ATCC 35852 / DSM 46488 / JCM 4925 / NBRC 14057 / NRRL 8057) TaxID=1003195 RepID=G8WS43_STREN|nr:hypothetical protein SCATT_24320 [Streptantibioticus cattleyicolor NRRL 8057 = DSM 46488]